MSQVFDLTEQYRKQLMSREDQARLSMLKDYRGVWRGLDTRIEKAAKRIEFSETEAAELAQEFKDEIAESSGDGALSADKLGRFTDLLLKKNSWQELERDLDGQYRNVADGAANVTDAHRRALGQSAVDHAVKLMQAQIGKERLAGMSRDELAELTRKTKEEVERQWQEQRDDLQALFREKATAAAQQAREALRQEVLHGLLVNADAKQILGRVKTAIEDRENEPERDPTLIRALRAEYRIATQESYRESMRMAFTESGRVSRWRWTSRRDSTTCAVCWAMDGKVFPADTPMKSHPHCRCIPVPVVEDDEGNSLREIRGDERDGGETGETAFSDISPQQQKAILGMKAFAAYERGEFDLSDLVGVQFNTRFGVTLYRQSVDHAREKMRGPILSIQDEVRAGMSEGNGNGEDLPLFDRRAENREIDRDKLVAFAPFGQSNSDPRNLLRQGADTTDGEVSFGLGGFGQTRSLSRAASLTAANSQDSGKVLTFYTQVEVLTVEQTAELIMTQGLRAVGDWLKFLDLVNKHYGKSFTTKQQIISYIATGLDLGDDKRIESKVLDGGKRYITIDFTNSREADFWYGTTTEGLAEKKKKEAENVGAKPENFIGSNPYFEPETDLGQTAEEGAEDLPENQRSDRVILSFPDDGSPLTMRRLLSALIFQKWAQGELFYDARDRVVDEAIRDRVTLVSPDRMNVERRNNLRFVDVYISKNWEARLYRIYAREKDRQNEAEEIWRQITENNEFSRVIRGLAKGAANLPIGIYEIVTDIPGTVDGIYTMVTDPLGTIDRLKEALGDKWQAFQDASYLNRIEMVSELGGEIIAELLLTKGVAKVAKTPLQIARATRPGQIITNQLDELSKLTKSKTDDLLSGSKDQLNNVIDTTKQVIKPAIDQTAEAARKSLEGLKRLLESFNERLKRLKRGTRDYEALKNARDKLAQAIKDGKTKAADIFSKGTLTALTAILDQIVDPTLKTVSKAKGTIRNALEKRRADRLTELKLKQDKTPGDGSEKVPEKAPEKIPDKPAEKPPEISVPPKDMADKLVERRNLLTSEKAKVAYDKLYESMIGTNHTSRSAIKKFEEVMDDLEDAARRSGKTQESVLDNLAGLTDERKLQKMDPYRYLGKNNGTVARVENSDSFGLNTNARGGRDNPLNEGPREELYNKMKDDGFFKKDGKFKDKDESLFLTHAEAESLMIEASKNGGKFQKQVTMYVDRRTCDVTCIDTDLPDVGLSKLARYYKIEELTIIDSLGNTFKVRPNMPTEVIERASKRNVLLNK